MVSRTLESVPLHLRQQQPGRAPRRYLDYGCAEGAITAALGRQLGLTPDCVFGADVRAIPSVGFTFVHLPAEGDAPPGLGSILPSVADQSIDLITSAMVFHHVTHVKAALLELRRIVSPTGALVIREHHCTSADMGAFLDVTHGLYSLSWSSPVEWPDFISEYKAFYRSREEWDALIRETGFALAVEEVGQQAVKNYRSAEFANRKPNGYFPNVIKGYYAVYKPIPNFKLPARVVVPVLAVPPAPVPVIAQSASVPAAAASAVGAKRRREEEPNAGEEDKLFESSKYPGRFYRINRLTGATEWV
jgi:SAM-dependent methyltransferase